MGNVQILLRQHVGAPCQAIVKAGDKVQKGTKIAVTGRLQTGSYTNRDGQRVYTTDVVIESQEFCESKAASSNIAQNYFADNTFMADGQDEAQYQYFN